MDDREVEGDKQILSARRGERVRWSTAKHGALPGIYSTTVALLFA